MRRLLVSVIAASGLVLIGAGAASAEQAPSAGAAQAAAGRKVCTISDERLAELSGIVATDDGFVVVNDSSDRSDRNRVFFLDDKCAVVDDVSYSGDGPRDTEDMGLSPDGRTLWIADIGDNLKNRRTVALWSMPSDGSKKPRIHRLAYPDGKHDAEALLISGDGTPIIVTKEFGRAAALYAPTRALRPDTAEGVRMRKIGQVTVPASDTSGNTLARIGRATIDGGAVSRDGTKVVLRTYTDALEWDVRDGDVAAALKGKPRVTPLPDEPFGEAVSYSPDGRSLYTVSDMGEAQDGTENHILRYTPAAQAATARALDGAADGAGGGPSDLSWYDNLTINDITYIVGGVGLLGAILVGAGVFGIMRSRKRPPPGAARRGDDPDGPDPADAETELITVGGAASGRGSGVYGGKRPASGPVYGSDPAAGSSKGGVYGGRPPAGGRPASGGQPGGRPAGGGQSGGRPVRAGQPGGRPAGGGQSGGRAGGPPAGGASQPARPGAGQPGRPVPGGRPVVPGGQSQPGRSGSGGRPVAPGGQPQSGRSGSGGLPVVPGGQSQPGRSRSGGRPVAPGGQPQPGRSGSAARPVVPGNQQQPGRPGAGGGQGPAGGRAGADGVHGASPPSHPQGPGRATGGGGAGQRPSGFFGQGAGHAEPGRGAAPRGSERADSPGHDRSVDSPGYGGRPYRH